MKLKNDFSALVLIGGWNKNIFNHQWVSKFLLVDEKLKVEFPLNFDGSPRISSKKIRIFVIGSRLNFVAINNKDENFERIQELAMKMADYLPHTPVTEFGVNFIFEDKINDSLKKLLKLNDVKKLADFGGSIKKTQHKHCFEFEKKLITLNISPDNSNIEFNFNFHFDISDLADFKAKISANNIIDLKKITLDIMKEVYSLELEREP